MKWNEYKWIQRAEPIPYNIPINRENIWALAITDIAWHCIQTTEHWTDGTSSHLWQKNLWRVPPVVLQATFTTLWGRSCWRCCFRSGSRSHKWCYRWSCFGHCESWRSFSQQMCADMSMKKTSYYHVLLLSLSCFIWSWTTEPKITKASWILRWVLPLHGLPKLSWAALPFRAYFEVAAAGVGAAGAWWVVRDGSCVTWITALLSKLSPVIVVVDVVAKVCAEVSVQLLVWQRC